LLGEDARCTERLRGAHVGVARSSASRSRCMGYALERAL
jgi:hypothetical protein